MGMVKKGNALTTARLALGTTYQRDRYGKTIVTAPYHLDDSILGVFLASPPAPPITGVGFESVNIVRNNLGISRGIVTYMGAPAVDQKTYEVGQSLSTDPIETWEYFFKAAGYPDPNAQPKTRHIGKANADGTGTDLGGIWIAGELGAIADTAKFAGWARNTAAAIEMRGVTSYLLPQITWTETIISKTKPSLGTIKVGKIDTSLPGTPPTLSGSANWILESLTQVDQGAGEVWTTRRTWRASGVRGWNPYIYGTLLD